MRREPQPHTAAPCDQRDRHAARQHRAAGQARTHARLFDALEPSALRSHLDVTHRLRLEVAAAATTVG